MQEEGEWDDPDSEGKEADVMGQDDWHNCWGTQRNVSFLLTSDSAVAEG